MTIISQKKQKKPKNKYVLVRLDIDTDILDTFRASGPGWQTRMNDALRFVIGLRALI